MALDGEGGKSHSEVIQVGGMTCANCSARIESALSALPGVFEARADFSRGEAFVRFDPAAVPRGAIEREITRLGYTAGGGNEIARTAVLLLTIVGLYAAVERLGLLNALVPSRLAGSDTKIDDATIAFIKKAAQGNSLVYGGFGISRGEQSKILAPYVEAVVAGSVFVRIITENACDKDRLFAAVRDKARELSRGRK